MFSTAELWSCSVLLALRNSVPVVLYYSHVHWVLYYLTKVSGRRPCCAEMYRNVVNSLPLISSTFPVSVIS